MRGGRRGDGAADDGDASRLAHPGNLSGRGASIRGGGISRLARLGRLEQPQRVKAKVAWLALRLVDGHVVDLRGADRLEGAHPEEQQEELLRTAGATP